MLKRNARVKDSPERWQECNKQFDLVFTFEDRVFDTVLEDMASREQQTHEPVYVFNLNTKDSHEEATIAASQALILIQLLNAEEDWEDHLDDILDKFQQRTGRQIIHSVMFY